MGRLIPSHFAFFPFAPVTAVAIAVAAAVSVSPVRHNSIIGAIAAAIAATVPCAVPATEALTEEPESGGLIDHDGSGQAQRHSQNNYQCEFFHDSVLLRFNFIIIRENPTTFLTQSRGNCPGDDIEKFLPRYLLTVQIVWTASLLKVIQTVFPKCKC